VVCANALQEPWESVCPHEPGDEVYLIGNPPFLGQGHRDDEQAEDMAHVFRHFKKHKYLDFVACWHWLGANYLRQADRQGAKAELAFVSTNSINQGVQVATLWPPILNLGVKIRFAYQGFKWKNNAKDQAGVHVAVIGLTGHANPRRSLFIQGKDKQWERSEPTNISPYLLSAGDAVVTARRRPLVACEPMLLGSKPTDGGHLIMSNPEKEELIQQEPASGKWIKRLMGADEFLKGKERWCLWLVDASSEEMASMPAVQSRVDAVRAERLESTKRATREIASRPHTFDEIKHPAENYILVPSVTSERRHYAPIGFFGPDVVATNAVQIIPHGTPYGFGILQTRMHMLWLQTVGGRLKSDFRYSNTLVYNTFPWPEPTAAQREAIEQRAQDVLDTRALYPAKTMSELYDPDKMPADLLEAHQALDRAVEQAYRPTPFRNDNERLEYLFKRYETLIAKEGQA